MVAFPVSKIDGTNWQSIVISAGQIIFGFILSFLAMNCVQDFLLLHRSMTSHVLFILVSQGEELTI
jgi:hypothetical protein